MYRLILTKPENDALVTETNQEGKDELTSSRLKLVYDLGLEFFEKKGMVPVKPAEMGQKEWEETGWFEALAQLIRKIYTPENKKSVGFIDIAILDNEIHDFLKDLNFTVNAVRLRVNRKQKRTESCLARREERYQKGLMKARARFKAEKEAKIAKEARENV